jgi:hypothetical protein
MRKHRVIAGLFALLIAATVWLPCLHCFFRKSETAFYQPAGLSPQARQLTAWQIELWTNEKSREQELLKMRASNAEWDFMGRSFFVWSLANIGLRDSGLRPICLETMDRIIAETLRLEEQQGMYFFLMPYAKARPYFAQPAHSLFLDGEIALMLASRRMLEEKAEYKQLLADRISGIVGRFEQSKLLALESYPNECWMFDHVVALDAICLADRLDGTDHMALVHKWLAMAKQKLVHRQSGLLISSFTTELQPLDGPEGSSIWMIAHGLQLVDPEFARDQYNRARHELGRIKLGFGYAREWPDSWTGQADVDSGPIIPVFKISAGASGMAFIGATAFADQKFLAALAATLDFAAFPSRQASQLKYCASNPVGDAALLYAATLGPLWQRAKGTIE